MKYLALLALCGTAWAADPQQLEISNANIHAKLYVPDAKTGYYQATRFDWAGSIASLDWKGRNYFGKWFDRYDPKIHDAITGPVEEFSELGYAEAAVGETFLKIGVGALRKPAEQAYDKFKTYEIANPGQWIVIAARDHIDFEHFVTDTNGYAYEYRKTVLLTPNGFVLDHSLRNTGRKVIDTSVYEHNFYMLDGQPSGPNISVKLEFAPKAVANLRGLAETKGYQIAFLKELVPGETVLTNIEGFSGAISDYDIRVENRATGTAVRQTSNKPISKMVFWSIRTTVCPEAYIDVRVEPGGEVTWRINYDFYTVSTKP
ncbi:MAG: hypothetical protein ABI811_10415 [Acidobacteriota bacterium]